MAIRLSVFYPSTEGATFDHDYYRDKHVPLAAKTWGLDGAEIDKGVDGPYVAAVQRRAVLAAEHEAVFLPPLPRGEPFGGLTGAVGAERRDRPGGQLQHARALGVVTLDPHGPEDGHRAGREINLIPRDRPGLLGTGADEQRRPRRPRAGECRTRRSPGA